MEIELIKQNSDKKFVKWGSIKFNHQFLAFELHFLCSLALFNVLGCVDAASAAPVTAGEPNTSYFTYIIGPQTKLTVTFNLADPTHDGRPFFKIYIDDPRGVEKLSESRETTQFGKLQHFFGYGLGKPPGNITLPRPDQWEDHSNGVITFDDRDFSRSLRKDGLFLFRQKGINYGATQFGVLDIQSSITDPQMGVAGFGEPNPSAVSSQRKIAVKHLTGIGKYVMGGTLVSIADIGFDGKYSTTGTVLTTNRPTGYDIFSKDWMDLSALGKTWTRTKEGIFADGRLVFDGAKFSRNHSNTVIQMHPEAGNFPVPALAAESTKGDLGKTWTQKVPPETSSLILKMRLDPSKLQDYRHLREIMGLPGVVALSDGQVEVTPNTFGYDTLLESLRRENLTNEQLTEEFRLNPKLQEQLRAQSQIIKNIASWDEANKKRPSLIGSQRVSEYREQFRANDRELNPVLGVPFFESKKTSSLPAQTTARSCVIASLSHFIYNPDLISTRLSEVPSLRKLIVDMMADPSIPLGLKRIIKMALEDSSTTVVKLTDEVRRQHNLPPEIHAGHYSSDTHFAVEDVAGLEKTSNAKVNETIESSLNITESQTATLAAHPQHTVLLPERPISGQTNDLVRLVHELAHVRMTEFLNQNIASLAGRLSPHLVRSTGNGQFVINRQLFDFLQERYALQTEYEALKSTYPKYSPTWLSKYGPIGSITDAEVTRVISETVINDYKITDPTVLPLRGQPIIKILMGN